MEIATLFLDQDLFFRYFPRIVFIFSTNCFYESDKSGGETIAEFGAVFRSGRPLNVTGSGLRLSFVVRRPEHN
jgi:hypothetical protein